MGSAIMICWYNKCAICIVMKNYLGELLLNPKSLLEKVKQAIQNRKSGSVAKCSFQTWEENLCIKKVSENRKFGGSH